MSHIATNWAFQQRGLKPATHMVLLRLCDRHNPDYGCFPKQNQLANDCEMARSTLNLHLKKLEILGLLRRHQRVDQDTKQQCSTRYYFAFEEGFETIESRVRKSDTGFEKSVKNQGESVSENRTWKMQKPCPKNGQSRVRKSDTYNPVIEPVRKEKDIPLTGYIQKEKDTSGDFDRDFGKRNPLSPHQPESGLSPQGKTGTVDEPEPPPLEIATLCPPPQPQKRQRSKAGTRIPEDWEVTKNLEMYAIGKGFDREKIVTEAEKFKNYWLGASGQNAVKCDWDATWRNWIIKAGEMAASNRTRRDYNRGRSSAIPDTVDFLEEDRRLASISRGYPVDRPPSGPVTVAGLAMQMALEHEKAGE